MTEVLPILRLGEGALLPGERISLNLTGDVPFDGDRVFVIPHRPAGSTGDRRLGTIAKRTRRHETLVELAGSCRGRMRPDTGALGSARERADVDAIEAAPDPAGAGYLRAALDELAALDPRLGISKGMFDEHVSDASLLADIVALVLQLGPDERLALLDLEDPAARVRGAATRIDAARDDARARVGRRTSGAGADRVRAVLREFAQENLAYEEMKAIPVDDLATVDALIDGLEAQTWRAVMACTHQLGRATTARDKAVDALRSQLRHEQELVGQAAVEALGDLGPHAIATVPDVLARLLAGDGDLQQHGLGYRDILHALGAIGGPLASREVASFARHCLVAPTAFHALSAYRVERKAPPGVAPDPPSYAKPEEGVYDGFDLLEAACEGLGRMPNAGDAAALALRDVALSPRSGSKPRGAAIRGLLLQDRTPAAVTVALDVFEAARRGGPELHAPSALDALFECGTAFHLVVERLVRSGKTGAATYQDPTPALARFVAHASFGGAGLATLRDLLGAPDARVRAEGAELAGYVRDGSPLLAVLRERLTDADRGVALAAATALTRLRDASDETRRGLRTLLASGRIAGDADAEDALRDSLAVLGAPVPAPVGESASDRSLGFFPLRGALAGAPRLEGTTFFVPWLQSTPPDVPAAWRTDADRVGLLRVELAAPPPVVTEEVAPVDLPIRATGTSGAKRELALRARLPEGLLFSLESPFYDHRGWGQETFLLVFDPGPRTWSWLTKSNGPSGYELTWIDGTDRELPSRAVAGGELILWMEGERLRLESDGTPYHLDDWTHSEGTSAALGAQKAWQAEQDAAQAGKPVEGVSVHRWVVDGEVVRDIRRFVLENDPRVASGELASLSPVSFFAVRAGNIPAIALLVRAVLAGGGRFESLLLLRRK